MALCLTVSERYAVIKGAACQMVPTTSLGETGILMSGEFPHTLERFVMLEPLRMALRQSAWEERIDPGRGS